MADNVAVTAGSGTTIAADDIGSGVLAQRVKPVWGPDGTGNDTDVATGKPLPIQLRGSDGTDRSNLLPVSIAAGNISTGATSIAANEDTASADADTGVKILFKRQDTPANTSGTDGDYEMPSMSAGAIWTTPLGYFVTCSTDITRPADTNAYTANDTWADSTSAPTSGGFTLTSAARKSGGSGIISDIMVVSSAVPGTLLQGELHIFNQAATAVNDNAAWNLSDSDAKNRIAIVPFTLVTDANNSYYHAQNLNIGFTCTGTANLRYLVKVKNAYTPVSAEVLTVIVKCIGVN